MRDVSGLLKEVYNGSAVALVPGGGTYAMEAVARQFGRAAR
jgi:aspartate aminotransferase-like enzyme